MLLDVFADKRCTGTNFDRPEFERLLKALQERKVNCIVVATSPDWVVISWKQVSIWSKCFHCLA